MININNNTMNLFPYYEVNFNRKLYNGQLFYLKYLLMLIN